MASRPVGLFEYNGDKLNWKSTAEWNKLKAGIDCPMCDDIWHDENAYGFKVMELETSIVRVPWNLFYRGWTVVALKRHANELFELSSEELNSFWSEVSITAKALYEIYGAAKINYNVWGSHVPHIHCHLFVFTFDSDPSALLNPHEKVVRLTDQEYAGIKDKLIQGINNNIKK